MTCATSRCAISTSRAPTPRGGWASRRRTPPILIKRGVQTALGRYPSMDIFGEDYPTRDGTCVRDYIQVTDLIDAHLAALAYLRGGGDSLTCNCGYGHGATVKEVIDVVKRVSGVDFTVNHVGRRAGDPAAIVAKAERVRRVLGWRPEPRQSRRISSGRRWTGNGACIIGRADPAALDRRRTSLPGVQRFGLYNDMHTVLSRSNDIRERTDMRAGGRRR